MSIFSKAITRDPQKIGEMRDIGINLNDFEGPIDTSTFGGLIKKAITRVQPTGIINQPFIGRDFSMFDKARMGRLPMGQEQIIPGYNEEMNIDDTGKIRIRDYLKDFAGQAGEGIVNTLAGQDRRSAFARAGLGSLLFGFNPITALLGAFIGSKAPDIYSGFQGKNISPLSFIREKRAEREAAKAREQAAAAAQMQQQNRMDETGGYQSSFADDTSFMEGSGTAADMGSF